MSSANVRRSLLVCCDLRSYGSADDQLQRELQELLVRSLDRAGASAGLDRTQWTRQAKGDEEWAVLPPHTPERVVVDDYVRALDAELSSVNQWRVPEAKVRMRVAMHHGMVMDGANGFPGKDSVLVSRLLNSKPAHQALEQVPSADLVLVLSEFLYDSLVEPGHTTLRAKSFRRVEVAEKTFTGHGWMWIPHGDVHGLDLSPGTPAPSVPPVPPAAAEPAPGSVNQSAVAHGGSTVVQAGRDATMPTQRADLIQNFERNDQRGSYFGPVTRARGNDPE
ncbi:hypothetical protein [Actinosynnema sp. NPDC020468]|uniref:hypothetical protein n=1 Tax=Actinosynnema sp. NPDC020468 TaxID=3154488 RepID=UPI0033CD5030